jgi:hypothetical protein
MNWTTPQDIRERWIGDDAPTNDELLRALISDAEAVILHEYPAIQARINAATLSQAVVTMVTCRMVTRVLRNPENASYISQTTGPFTQARNLGQTDLWLTSDEEELLAPKKSPGAFSVDMAPHAGAWLGNLILVTGNGYVEGEPRPPHLEIVVEDD